MHLTCSRNRIFFCAPFSLFAAILALAGMGLSTLAAERGFPYDTELLLDASPMRGSRRVPILTIGPRGAAEIDLWCDTIPAELVVTGDTITIVTGAKTEKRCELARMRADDDLIAALATVTNWRRDGDALVLRGAKTMRFRRSTH
jgi:heat shock protein HslJ